MMAAVKAQLGEESDEYRMLAAQHALSGQAAQVRKTPSRPKSGANFSLF
jgi:hypothetical protein